MLGLFFVYFVLCIGGFFLSFYKKKFEESLILSFGSIILFLYIFYILNILNIGFDILLFLLGLVFAYSIIKFIKSDKKKDVLSNFFTPGFIIYTLAFIVIYLIVRNREVLLWDELRLWGAYPKILYYDGKLQLGNLAKIIPIMQSYEPGMPLFQYFFTKTAFSFKESYLFLAYAILCLSTVLPITKNITYKKWYLIPLFTILVLFIPLCLANSTFDGLTYYYTLFIEPALGLFFGYTLYLSTTKMDTKLDKAIFYISLGTLVLLKDTGIIFAIVSYLSYLFIQKKSIKKFDKKSIISLIIPIILCISLFGSWKIVQKVYSTNNMYAATMDKSEITTFFTNMSSEQKEIVNTFIDESLKTSFDSNFDRLERFTNFYVIFLFIVISLIIITLLKNKKERFKYKTVTIWYSIGSIFFIVGTLGLFIFSLHLVASFPRYSSIVLTSGLLLIIMFVVDGIFNKEKYFNILGIYLVLFFVLVTPLKAPSNAIDYLKEYAKESNKYSDVLVKNVKPEDSVLVLFGSSTAENFGGVIYQHHLYMNLIDEGYSYLPYTVYNSYSDHMAEDTDLEEIMKYDYVYFFIVNEEDKNEFSNILPEEIEETTLYKIDNNQFIKVS